MSTTADSASSTGPAKERTGVLYIKIEIMHTMVGNLTKPITYDTLFFTKSTPSRIANHDLYYLRLSHFKNGHNCCNGIDDGFTN